MVSKIVVQESRKFELVHLNCCWTVYLTVSHSHDRESMSRLSGVTTSFSPCKSRKTTEKCQKMPKKSRKKRRSHKFKKPGSVPLKAVLLHASKSARVFFRIRLIDSFLTCDTRGIQDLNAGPGVGLGWVVGLAVRPLFFFFWPTHFLGLKTA